MNSQAIVAYRLSIPVNFPEGVHPGNGADGNRLVVARDGAGQPVLRGSAVAGVLRSAYAATGVDGSNATVWFGEAVREDAISNSSRIVIEDARFPGLKSGADLPEMMHNAIIRHTRAVYDNALFTEERIPPGAKTEINLTITCPTEEAAAAERFAADLAGIFKGGLFFGGATARGMGRAVVAQEGICWKKYRLSDVAGEAEWLDDQYARRQGLALTGMSPLHVDQAWREEALTVNLILRLAQGQDLLVAEGHEMYPMSRQNAGGQEQWVLPGSTLRGLLRAWITRLAAREGLPVMDRVEPFREHGPMKFADLGWGGITDLAVREKYQENPASLDCPVLQLFGSLYAKGRIHVSDAHAPVVKASLQTQKRMHVAVDRFSGGANEGALFENHVLVDTALRFPVVITIADPTEREARWLAQSLKALDLGLIRLGSSKASGRMTVEKPVHVTGEQSGAFSGLMKEEG